MPMTPPRAAAAAAMAPATCVSVINASQRSLSAKVKDTVLQALTAEGSFTPALVARAVQEFTEFQRPESYETYFTPKQITEHVRSYIAASVGNAEKFDISRELDKYAYYWCEDTFEAQQATIQAMERYVGKQLTKFPGHGVSVASYSSAPVGSSGSKRNVIFYAAELFPFVDPSGKGTDLASVSTAEFMTRKRPAARDRYQELVERLRTTVGPVYSVSKPLDDGTTVFTVAVNDERLGHLSQLYTLLNNVKGAHVSRTFCETFSDKTQVYSIFVTGASEEALRNIGTNFSLLPQRPRHPLLEAYKHHKLGYEQVIFGHALMVFCQYFTPSVASDDFSELSNALKNDEARLKRLINMRAQSAQELLTDAVAGGILAENTDFLNALFAEFSRGATEAGLQRLNDEAARVFPAGSIGRAVASSCVRFVSAVRRHNFFRSGRAAIAYRLDPAVVLQGLDLPRTPYGIYLVVGSDFRGFHVRFHDIARGGVRLIVSKNETLHAKNKRTLFQENYNLALTQTLKNKDIPESGSKGTVLVSMRCPRNVIHYKRNFMQYVDSLLDNMLESEGVRDTLKKPELLFLGPDENTAADFPTVAAEHAKRRGFPMWKSLTTGKSPALGGVPHDVDGMTTRSVRIYVNGIYSKLGLDGTKLTKVMTGGPDGDLGSNEIKQGTEAIRGLCDGTATVIDPEGVDITELRRLANGPLALEHFNPAKLSKKGVFKLVDDKTPITGPDGEVYTNGEDFRNKFHFHPWVTCETFVPCGGRPSAVDISNVHKFLINAPGVTGDMMLAGSAKVSPQQLRFKYIVEGANLFITPDARLALERCGVVLFKDSSANKGGVTSSSVEVYTGMALSDAQHAEHMCVKDEHNPPAFYRNIKKDIIARVEANARSEFECIWRDSQAGKLGGLKSNISDALSRKIVAMVESISASTLHEDQALLRYVIHEYTPKTLLTVVSLDDIFARVPISYLRAIFAKSIASNFVYSVGVEANDFAFFEYMRVLLTKSHAWNAQQKK